MNKIILLISITFVTSIFSQTKKNIYVDDKQDYVILLNKNINVSNKDMQDAEVDVFTSSSNGKFNFTLLISKIFEHNFKEGNILDDTYEDYYKSTCGCSILDKEIVYYNNLRTLRYKIKIIKANKTFIGFNDSFVSNNLLYNVLFLTFEDKFSKQQEKYYDIMNDFLINGKTTIDNYKEYKKK